MQKDLIENLVGYAVPPEGQVIEKLDSDEGCNNVLRVLLGLESVDRFRGLHEAQTDPNTIY
jgi:hypothetical protein